MALDVQLFMQDGSREHKITYPIRCAFVVKGSVLLHPGTTLNTCTQIIALSHNSCLSLTLHALMADCNM